MSIHSIDLIEIKERNNRLFNWNQTNQSSTKLNWRDSLCDMRYTDCSEQYAHSIDDVEIKEIIALYWSLKYLISF